MMDSLLLLETLKNVTRELEKYTKQENMCHISENSEEIVIRIPTKYKNKNLFLLYTDSVI